MTCKVSSPQYLYFRQNPTAKFFFSHMVYITPTFYPDHFRPNGLSDLANFFLYDVKSYGDYDRIFYFDPHGNFLEPVSLHWGPGFF